MANSIIDPSVGPLTHRERFRRLMHFEPVDRGIHWEFGYLEPTMKRWHKEGLPQHLDNMGAVETYFGVEPRAGIPINVGFIPPFEGEDEVIEERENSHGDHRIPEDVPYENYRYYVREKLVMLGWSKNEIESIPGLS